MKIKPCIVGFDFGTTSLSAVIINTDKVCIDKVFCYNTNAYISSIASPRYEQSIEVLSKLFETLLHEIDGLTDISIQAYGFTGQMHGIVGLNKHGRAVTNLVTWEDKSGDIPLPEGMKLLDKVKQLSGNNTLSNGYGIVTLYKWLNVEKRTDIAGFCTIADYFATCLTGNKNIKMSPSMAHSIGLFNIHSNQWDEDAILRLGLNPDLFPAIINEGAIIGHTLRNAASAPIIMAMGDNQASFFGSVTDKENSILLNVGTGTQLSALIHKKEKSIFDKYIDDIETQLRPYDKDNYLMSTSFVNGGSAYKSLFNFFKESAKTLFELNEIDEVKLWQNMEKIAHQGRLEKDIPTVNPLFAGQRKDSSKRAEITDLTLSNFNPTNFVTGFLVGLAKYYKAGFFPELAERIEYVCGSGNGLKRNRELVETVKQIFDKPIYLVTYDEEAAVGATLNAAKAIEIVKSENECKIFLTNLATPNK